MSASLLLGHLEESSCSGPELVLDLTLGGEVPRGKDWWGAASAGLWGTGHSVRIYPYILSAQIYGAGFRPWARCAAPILVKSKPSSVACYCFISSKLLPSEFPDR